MYFFNYAYDSFARQVLNKKWRFNQILMSFFHLQK